MAIYPAPATVLVPTLLLGVGLAARAALAPRDAETPRRLPWALAIVYLALALGAWPLFPAGDRLWPVELGLLSGAVVAAGSGWLGRRTTRDPLQLGPLGAGLAAAALIALVVPDPTLQANGLLGLVAAWGALALADRLMADAPLDAPVALTLVSTVAAAAAWGEKLHPGANLGAPLALGLGAVFAVALAVGGLLRRDGDSRLRGAHFVYGWTARLAAFGVFAVGALILTLGVFGQPGSLAIAVLLGAAAGLLAPAALGPAETPLKTLAFLGLGGGLLVVDNRLLGITAIALGGLGWGLASLGSPAVRVRVALLVGIFGARAWLQLFLDRTLLTGYGIDLTHPYAFAALVLGGLAPLLAIAVARLSRPSSPLTAVWAAALALLPVWVGYFVHVEALGGMLAGLVLAAFALGLSEGPDAEQRAVIPTLLTTHVAVTLLAAPWLVGVMNASRQSRMVAFVAGLVVAAVWVGAWWALVARRPVAA